MASPGTNISFDSTLGALFLGAISSTLLFGIALLQTYNYWTSPRMMKDGWILRMFVLMLLYVPSAFALLVFNFIHSPRFIFRTVDTAAQCLLIGGVYNLLITNFGSPQNLARPNLGFLLLHVEGFLSEVISLSVQSFYGIRVGAFILSTSFIRKYGITIIIFALALASFSTQCAYIKSSLHQDAFFEESHEVTQELTYEFIAAQSLGMACDILITLSMVFLLWSSKTGMKRSDSALRSIILFSVNSGLAFTSLGIVLLITFLLLPSTNVFGALGVIVSQVYCNSALASLNARESIAQKLSAPMIEFPMTSIQFADDLRPLESTNDAERGKIMSRNRGSYIFMGGYTDSDTNTNTEIGLQSDMSTGTRKSRKIEGILLPAPSASTSSGSGAGSGM